MSGRQKRTLSFVLNDQKLFSVQTKGMFNEMRNILNMNKKHFCIEFNIKSNKSITKTDNILDTVITLSEN